MSKRLVVTDGVVAGNPYDKYGTNNPVARRLMSGFMRGFDELLDQAGDVRSVLEVGCGEGHITSHLAKRYGREHVTGTDVSPEILAIAGGLYPDLRFEERSVYDIGDRGDRWDLIVACEVFEHLDAPARALQVLAGAARKALILTVPREPLWRTLNMARGKYWSRLGNSHGHVQHWSRRAFLAFVETQLEVRASRTPLPWTQALGVPRPGSPP